MSRRAEGDLIGWRGRDGGEKGQKSEYSLHFSGGER